MHVIDRAPLDAALASPRRPQGDGVLGAYRRWRAYRETVRALNALTERQLEDIGVDGDVKGFARRVTGHRGLF